MDKVAEFERQCQRYKELALKAATPEMRIKYMNLADMWQRMAEERRTYIQSRAMD